MKTTRTTTNKCGTLPISSKRGRTSMKRRRLRRRFPIGAQLADLMLMRQQSDRRYFAGRQDPMHQRNDMRKAALLFSALIAAARPSPNNRAPPASLVREGVTEKLTAPRLGHPGRSAPRSVPNVGIVVGKKAVLVIDTGMGTRNGETVLREVAKVGAGKPIYHRHHARASRARHGRARVPKDSKLIRSKDQIEDIAAGAGMNLVPVFAQRSALNVELLQGAKHRDADIVFDQDYYARPRRRQGEDLRHGHQPHARRHRRFSSTACCSRATSAMRPQPSFANPTAKISHWLREPRPARGAEAQTTRARATDLSATTPSSTGYRGYLTHIRDRAGRAQEGRQDRRTKRFRSSPMRCPRSIRTRTGSRARSAQDSTRAP